MTLTLPAVKYKALTADGWWAEIKGRFTGINTRLAVYQSQILYNVVLNNTRLLTNGNKKGMFSDLVLFISYSESTFYSYIF